MKVLIAEDDPNTREGLREILEAEGYEVLTVPDGQKALETYRAEKPQVLCLDIMMPQVNGYDVCREIRRTDPRTPILFISAKSEEIDKVLGLEIGADDFIVKPFGVKEVIARIRAVTRRTLAENPASDKPRDYSFTMDELRVVPAELRAYRDDQPIDLSLRDISVLELLYNNRGRVVDRDTFFDECWGVDYYPASRTLDQHVSQLRKRIEKDPAKPRIICTVHGAGYRFDE
ncbi:MAG: response regulator transcription factor [Opitutales bacterium]|nr:response regulator transcription factor [Opitutales bacterium]